MAKTRKKKDERPVFTHYGELHDGYDITAWEDQNGHYHVVIGLCGGDGKHPVVELSADLTGYIGRSRFTPAEAKNLWGNQALQEAAGVTWVHDDAVLSSVRSAFDSLCFGDEDPMYPDEVYCHISEIDDFLEFCNECKRRHKAKIGIGINDICPKEGPWCEKCGADDQRMCFNLWLTRHAKWIQNVDAPNHYPAVCETRRKRGSKKGGKKA